MRHCVVVMATYIGHMHSVVTQKVLLELVLVEGSSQHLSKPQLNVQHLLSHADSPASLIADHTPSATSSTPPITLQNGMKWATLFEHMHLHPLETTLYTHGTGVCMQGSWHTYTVYPMMNLITQYQLVLVLALGLIV